MRLGPGHALVGAALWRPRLKPAGVGAAYRGSYLTLAINAGVTTGQPDRAARQSRGAEDGRAARRRVRRLAPQGRGAAADGNVAAAAVAAAARRAVGIEAAHAAARAGDGAGVGPSRRALGRVRRAGGDGTDDPGAGRASRRAVAMGIGRVSRVGGISTVKLIGRARTAVGRQQRRAKRSRRALGAA